MPRETECPATHRFTLAELLHDPNDSREDPTAVPSEGPGPGPSERGQPGITRLPLRPATAAAKPVARNPEEQAAAESPLASCWQSSSYWE